MNNRPSLSDIHPLNSKFPLHSLQGKLSPYSSPLRQEVSEGFYTRLVCRLGFRTS